MRAYHNDPAIKTKLLADLAEHAAADHIVQGQYWWNGKGCAVACTLHTFDPMAAKNGTHSAYEVVFGIPQALARIEDRIFEGLPNGTAKEWPQRFAAAIQPGADLAMVVSKFLSWILSERLPQFIDKEKCPKVWQAAADIAELYREWCKGGTKPSRERFVKARANAAAHAAAYAYAYDAADAAHAAVHAADAAHAAVHAAVHAADAAHAAVHAADAAHAAVHAAVHAADAAHAAVHAADAAAAAVVAAAAVAVHTAAYAAAAAAYAAYAYADAAAANAANAADADAEYEIMADKLVELLKAAP